METELGSKVRRDSISVVVLTQGLRDELEQCLFSIVKQDPPFSQVIIVNNSNIELDLSYLGELRDNVSVLSIGGNFGTSARNIGAALAKAKYLLFIDDDITLSQTDTVTRVADVLSRPDAPLAVCFKVRTAKSEEFQPLSWGHPRERLKWQDRAFETDCITEGAFAIDLEVFRKVGGFWPGIFIGQEDTDLFLRLLRFGARVEYEPKIECVHLHSLSGRQSLRGFYHYSRSNVLITWRHLPFVEAILFLTKCYSMLFLQAIRSLSPLAFVYIVTGVIDGTCWIIGGNVARDPIDSEAKSKWKSIRSCVPSVWKRVWTQLTQKNL